MNDKLFAGLFTAVVIAPICAVCVLGPAVVGSVLAVAFGWIADLRPVVTTGLAIIAAILVYGFFRRRQDRRSVADHGDREGLFSVHPFGNRQIKKLDGNERGSGFRTMTAGAPGSGGRRMRANERQRLE